MNDMEFLKLTRDLAVETWNVIMKEIRPKISKIAFETWLLPCIPLALTDTELLVLVENDFYKEMLEKRYLELLNTISKQILFSPVEIKIINKNQM